MPSTAEQSMPAPEFLDIPVGDLAPHPSNVRRVVDVDTLVPSIKASGILEPLLIAPAADDLDFDGFVILAGHRRHAAAVKLGLATVPCFYHATLTDPATQIAIMLSENIERDNLTPAEEAAGIQAMLDLGESVTSISKATGMSRTRVKQRAKIGSLAGGVLDKIHEHEVTLADALFIAEHPAYTDRLEAALGTRNWWKEKEGVDREIKRRAHLASQVKDAVENLDARECDRPHVRTRAEKELGRAVDLQGVHGTWAAKKDAATAIKSGAMDGTALVFVCTDDYSSDASLVVAVAKEIAVDTTPTGAEGESTASHAEDPEAEAARRAAAKEREDLAAATAARLRFLRELTSDDREAAARGGRRLFAELVLEGDYVADAGIFIDSTSKTEEDIAALGRAWIKAATPSDIAAMVVVSSLVTAYDRQLAHTPSEHWLVNFPDEVTGYVAWLRDLGYVLSDTEEAIAAEFAARTQAEGEVA